MLNNQDFALLRAKSLGGSDVGAILGLNRYRSAVDVWMEKTGQSQDQADSLPIRFGSFAEEFVASEYSRATGLPLVNYPKALIHPQYSYMHGHIDRFICQSDRIFDESGTLIAERILECKTASPFNAREWGELGSDQVPMSYLVQCVWYMAITGIAHTDLAVLMGNTDFRIYEIHRDKELEEMVIDLAKSFWEERVLTNISPPAQRESDLKRLFPQAKHQKIIQASRELYEIAKKMSSIQEQITNHEEEISQIKQSIMAHMQDAEILTYQDQILATWKAPKPSLRVDTKRLSMDHPELMTEYQEQVLNSRRLVVKELA